MPDNKLPDVATPDYDLAETVAADTTAKVRAVMEPTRGQILDLILERAATVTELASALGRPKSSVAHHVDVLVNEGMAKVVRTRRVRAIEERFYGRVARTIIIGGPSDLPKGTVRSSFLSEASAEAPDWPEQMSTLRHVRISTEAAAEFFAEVVAMAERFTTLPRGGDTVYAFVAAVYPTDHPVLPDATHSDA